MDEVESDKTGKRERTKLRNRGVILDAAREVFVDIGYDAATVRDIVARTDLAPGTFYNYFPDKQSVLLALVGEASSVGSRRIREARLRATTLEERVYVGFRAYFEFIAGDRALFALMRRNFPTLRSLGMEETGFSEGLADLEAELRAAVRAGLMPELPIAYVTRAIGAITLELGAEIATHDPPDIEGATRFAADLFLGGLERISRKAQRASEAPRTRKVTRPSASENVHDKRKPARKSPRKQRSE
jgi:AcrR family transcriptional regulator